MPAPFLLDLKKITFPDPNLALADPNGLLAIGGDLKPNRLIAAYKHGIFPWYNNDQPILWWCPDPRAVLFLNELKISRSLAKVLRKQIFTVTFDQAFQDVINACAKPRKSAKGTWIQPEMIKAYYELHKLGYALSVEVWHEKNLVGGIYGIIVDNIFCGESMFSYVPNASKVALVHLVQLLKQKHFKLIDCQILNPHLLTLGAREISRKEFLQLLPDCLY